MSFRSRTRPRRPRVAKGNKKKKKKEEPSHVNGMEEEEEADQQTDGTRAGLKNDMGCPTTTRSRPASTSSTGSTQTISSPATTFSPRSATTPRKSSIWAPARASGPLTVRSIL